ncbi:unnamed protein product [Mycena citricolor]|uniref:Copper-fist domain-containing protein n=1 Tax=Mycena citricolor TaxID=2018698 RepID=A0AAD2HS89_9AGAR|nr:unnamed protein product [Mycena citricolor]
MNTHADMDRDKLYGKGPFDWTRATPGEARKFLIAKGFFTEEVPESPGPEDLALALLRTANDQTLPALAADAIKVTAYLIEKLNAHAQENVANDISDIRDMVRNNAERERTDATELRDAASTLATTVEKVYSELQDITDRLGSQVETLETKVAKLSATTNEITKGTTNPSTPTTVGRPYTTHSQATYADTLRREAEPVPTKLRADMAMARARDNQVTLRNETPTEPAVWAELTEKEALTKVKYAIEKAVQLTEEEGAIHGDPPIAAGVTKTRSGALVIHMASVHHATWLREVETMTRFLEAFGGTVKHAERLHMVIVQFVPVSFDPESTDHTRFIESNNNLPPGALGHARYVKPRNRHDPNQRFAHVILGLRTRQQANRILQHGICIEGKKVYGRKLLNEPIRCMKCQLYNAGHIARNCPLEADICARCAGSHRTSECNKEDDERQCANCKNKGLPHTGHGAADRNCPIFTNHLQASLQRNPDAKYQYYPIEDDPTTWTLTHEAQTDPMQGNGPPKRQDPTRFRQGLPTQAAAFAATNMTRGAQWEGSTQRATTQPPLPLRQGTLSFANHRTGTSNISMSWANEMDREDQLNTPTGNDASPQAPTRPWTE